MKLFSLVWGTFGKGRFLAARCTVCAALLLHGRIAFAVPPPSGLAPVLVPSGGFSIDGDLLANTASAGTGDWLPGSGGTGGSVLDATGAPINPATTFHFIDAFNSTSDNTFGGGLKWTDNPNIWQWTTGKASSKTDINNVLLHVAFDAQGHTWLVIAADRYSTSGESYIDFEFLQSSLVVSNNGKFYSSGANGGRTTNDVLLSLAFTSGGSVADFFAFRWMPNGSGGFAYVDSTAQLPANGVFVAANSATVPVPFGAFGQNTYAANAFAEAAIDLTALLGNFDQCLSIGVKTIMVKTKSSASSSATISDFINPIQYSLRLGPSAIAGPNQIQCNQGDSTTFALQGQATPGLYPIASTTWSVLSGTATIDDTNSLNTSAHVSSPTATLRLTAVQSNGCTETSDIVLTVAPIPTSSITGAAQVCPRSTTQFQGPPGMTTYSWSVSGGASISGPTNAQSVNVLAGGTCATNFSLQLRVANNWCSSSCITNVLADNTVPPTLTLPPNLVLECPANTSTNNTGVATAQGVCGNVAVSYSDAVTNGCGGSKVIARTWMATDLCGNAAVGVQTIVVQDTTPPKITAPPNLTLECPANTTTNATGVATAQDGCSAVSIVFSDVVSNSCGGANVIFRTWAATDACGNSASALQTITVRDTTRPTLMVPPNLALDCPADTTTNSTGVATAQDGCSAVTVSYSDVVSNSCGGTKTITRTWTAADGCGNSTNRIQIITVRDTTPPTITAPPNLVLQCPANTTTNATGVAIAQDGCSSVTLTYSDVVSNSCGGTKTITRTWTATDACGNKASVVQTIAVQDTSPPSITPPPNLVLQCPAATTTNVTGGATAQDGCSAATISYTDSVSNLCGGTKIISRTWRAADGCGNIASAIQTITVQDTTPPTITAPTNVVQECPGDTRTNVTGVAIAQDGCSGATVAYSDIISNSCGGAKVVFRTWTAIDGCGNIASALQTITVRDTRPPTVTAPASLTLECPANTSTNTTGVATATDGCSSVAITYSDSVSNSCGGARVISRIWTATDGCGNSASALQTITVRDTTPPTLSPPPNLVLDCPATTTTNATGVATALDGCSSVTLTYSDVVSNSCGGTKVIARTWTATDGCGNHVSALQTITVRDVTPPSITAPPNLVLSCPAATTTNVTGVATAQDGCSSVTISYSDSGSNNCGGTKIIARTWTATDSCGNTASALQTITVRDITAPTLTLPPNLVLECPAVTTTNVTGVATAQDGCSAATVIYSDAVSNACAGTKLILRTWTATDACGNSTNAVQTIAVHDTTPPTITAPPNLVLECPAITTTNATGLPAAQDGCSSVTISYSDSVSNICGGAKLISRTWTATDACGNRATALQTITIRDTTPPTITAPPNLVLECPANTSTNATGVAIAQDGCGSVALTYSDAVSNSCGGTKFIVRTWTATDGCGHSVSAIQTLTIRDTAAPRLTLPPNVVQQCPGDTRTNVTGVPVAVDGCGSVILTYSDVVTNGCGLTRTIQRLWTATDGCGNSTNALQMITVIDTTKPTLTCPNIAVQCAGDVPPAYTNLAAFQAAGGTASDACSGTLTFAFISDSGLIGKCPGRVTRVYQASDVCGNIAFCTNIITVQDTIPPVMACLTNTTVECGLPLTPAYTGTPTATDNCSTNVAITYSDSTTSSSYNLSFLVADPDINTGPYGPTYMELGPGSLPCPDSAIATGRALDPLRNAVAYAPNGQQDALTSIGNVPMAFGQIVPFEVVIEAGGGPGPERGTIDFTAVWSTYTTSNDRFGYDTNYMVYCAFVDAADPGSIDPNNNARVKSYSSVVVNQGTPSEGIQGTFRVSGIEPGDRIVVEVWMVLDSTMPGHVGGTVSSGLVAAQTVSDPPVGITVGTQTDSLGNLGKINPLPPPQQQPPLGPLPPQPSVPPGVLVSIINRTWTATDDCGNHSSCVQQISVRDSTPPALIIPSDLVLCPGADTSTNRTGTATATDACGSAYLYFSDTVSNALGGVTVVSRLWTAFDDGGNTTNALQTITLRDSAPPTITAPPSLVLECPADTRTNVTGVASAQDGCASVSSITYSDVVSNACGGTKVIARTWKATDSYGNSGTAVQTITVQDTKPPTITPPADVVQECPGDSRTNVTGVASSQDGCSSVVISYSDAATPLCGGSMTIARTWTATDACGHSSTAIQTITIRDTTPPVLVKASDKIVQGGTAWSFDAPSASDTCSAVTLKVLNTTTNIVSTNTVVTRVWEADDACGNTNSCQQTVTIISPPPIPVPAIAQVPQCQLVGYGDNTSLTVGASGSGPLTYQWRFNGTNINGATSSTLQLTNMLFNNAGLYTVVVSNGGGSVTSDVAVITVAPKLSSQVAGKWFQVSWPGPFTLQSATNPAGPYVDVPGATSPYNCLVSAAPYRFFRLRSPPLSVTGTCMTNRQFMVNVPNIPGCTFIIQASTNFVNWVSLQTNCAPCTFVDTNAALYPKRFYRGVMLK